MSEMPLRKHRSSEIQKIMATSVMVAIIDPTIHGRWLSEGQFGEHLCAKHPNGDAIQFDTNLLVRHLNTVFPRSSLDANEVKTFEGNKKVLVFRHEYQPKGGRRRRFLYITGNTADTLPRLPAYRNSSEWEENCVALKRELRSGSKLRQLFREVTIMPAALEMSSHKQQQTSTDEENAESNGFELSSSVLQLDTLAFLPRSHCLPPGIELACRRRGGKRTAYHGHEDPDGQQHQHCTSTNTNNMHIGTPLKQTNSSAPLVMNPL